MIVVLAWIFACALLYGLVKGGVLVFRAVRARAWLAPGLWAGGALMAGAATTGAYLAGAFAGLGGMDMGETCGEDQYDSAFVAAHQNDPLFPLHNWCNAEHDLVPSWVNPTVTGLAVLTAVCLAMTAVTGVARISRTLSARRVQAAQETQQREQKA